MDPKKSRQFKSGKHQLMSHRSVPFLVLQTISAGLCKDLQPLLHLLFISLVLTFPSNGHTNKKVLSVTSSTHITAPVLKLPDPNLPYEVIADASINGIGNVLVQEGHPVTVTVVEQGVCRGTLTWVLLCEKVGSPRSSHTVKVTELYGNISYYINTACSFTLPGESSLTHTCENH